MEPTGVVVNAPFLTPEEFKEACSELYSASIHSDCGTFDIQLHGSGCDSLARIRRSFATPFGRNDESGAMEVEEFHDQDGSDNDVVYPDDVQHEPSITVEYDILLSQTYCVPVLYFLVVKGLSTTLLDIDFIYQHLVPESQVPELQHVGVMGGITMTNHPVTDVPCFFVHPCRTAEALREIVGTRPVSPLEYLQIWMGLIGGCVGLNLPKELAIKEMTTRLK